MAWQYDHAVPASQCCNKGMCRETARFRVASSDWWRRHDGKPRGLYVGTVLFFCATHMGKYKPRESTCA